MASPKLVTVFGATGNQGGSVVRSLLRNSAAFRVRGITRNPTSPKAKELVRAGVEVVGADGFKKEELVKAFRDSWAIFANTNSDDSAFDDPNGPTELDLGRVIVDAANEVGVEHFVYSSAGHIYEITKGAVKLDMMDCKNKIEQLARNSPNIKSVTAVCAGWYFENFMSPFIAEVFGGFALETDSEGYVTLSQPLVGGPGLVPFISIEEDFGDLVHGVLLDPETWGGKTIQGISHLATFPEITESFTKVTGKKSRYVPIETEQFPTMGGIRALESIRDMYVFTQWAGGRYFANMEFDVEQAKALKKSVQDVVAAGDPKPLMSSEQFFAKMFSGNKPE
ncbi:NmrA family transcriptional regulator [Histoplasma capsulatum H143]|uniref:NmrA family transcriptional regulator n=1 Tax=Ajellomyces capsulatus (strain H143) TaxID=544712 RepID=C6HHI9_AJECH|nr:NmrA family transcriptional regulator [Histoplasma capsulatum H143]